MEQGNLDGTPNVEALIEYQEQRAKQRASVQSIQAAAPLWTDLGPSFNFGRVTDIAFHPQNSNIIYIASPGGGAYKSTDGGSTWSRLNGLPYSVLNSIAIDRLNPNVVYFATGGGNAETALSMGIYKTTDAGNTFSRLLSTVPTTTISDWQYITRVTTHPATPNLVFAGTRAGFFLSNDGGTTWAKPSAVPTYDIEIDPNSQTKMLRGRIDGAISYSTNSGTSWTQTQLVPSGSSEIDTRVKYAKSAPNVVYASVDQNKGELHKSVDGGVTWAKISTPAHNDTQGFHTNQLWVSPVDANHIIVGGVDLYRSTDGGQNFTKISDWSSNAAQSLANITPNTAHGDQNAIASPPNYSEANPRLFVGTDGGIYTATNARTVATSGWSKPTSGLNLTQFVGAAGRRLNGTDTIVGGTQDNGTLMDQGQGWSKFLPGDGGFSAIDPLEDAIYATQTNGAIFRLGLGSGVICRGITEAAPASCGSTNTDKANFYAPLELDPGNANRLYLGADSLWVSTNPKSLVPTWSVVKPPAAGSIAENFINAISIQKTNSNIVLVGHNDGKVFRTSNMLAATPGWSLLGGGLPSSRRVGALLVDPDDANRYYVGFTGFFADNLWRSDNAGASWRNISAGLPPGSIYTITRQPLAKEKLYVGTFWGSYGSDDGGNTWPVTNDGPYGAQIRRLFWLGNDTLYAATFGSGMAKATVTVSSTGPANYTDMWWAGAAENGWGMSIQQHGNVQFNAIYVYDSTGKPAWYVMPGGTWNANFTSYSGLIYQPSSAPLNNYNPAQFVVGASPGNVTITFTGNSTATLQYTINGISGQKSIQRQEFGGGTAPLTVGDMWFGGDAQNGWGISIVQRAGALFGAWYTYGSNGKVTWYVLPTGTWNGTTYSGSFYSTTGSPWLGATYNPNQLDVKLAGTMSLNFSGANSATMTYSFTSVPFAGLTQSKPIVRMTY